MSNPCAELSGLGNPSMCIFMQEHDRWFALAATTKKLFAVLWIKKNLWICWKSLRMPREEWKRAKIWGKLLGAVPAFWAERLE
jgi:hypothetical protein